MTGVIAIAIGLLAYVILLHFFPTQVAAATATVSKTATTVSTSVSSAKITAAGVAEKVAAEAVGLELDSMRSWFSAGMKEHLDALVAENATYMNGTA